MSVGSLAPRRSWSAGRPRVYRRPTAAAAHREDAAPAPAPGAHRLTSELGVERIRLVAGGLDDPVCADLETRGAREIAATDWQFAGGAEMPAIVPLGETVRPAASKPKAV
jgi:hypothetical protein